MRHELCVQSMASAGAGWAWGVACVSSTGAGYGGARRRHTYTLGEAHAMVGIPWERMW